MKRGGRKGRRRDRRKIWAGEEKHGWRVLEWVGVSGWGDGRIEILRSARDDCWDLSMFSYVLCQCLYLLALFLSLPLAFKVIFSSSPGGDFQNCRKKMSISG